MEVASVQWCIATIPSGPSPAGWVGMSLREPTARIESVPSPVLPTEERVSIRREPHPSGLLLNLDVAANSEVNQETEWKP